MNTIQRKRELARMTKFQLMDVIIGLEFPDETEQKPIVLRMDGDRVRRDFENMADCS